MTSEGVLEECNVKKGGVVVDKLKAKDFECVGVVKLLLRSRQFKFRQCERRNCVQEVEDYYHNKGDARC